MVFSTALVLTSLFGLGLSSPLATPDMKVQGSRNAPPNGFTSIGPALPDTLLDMRIALTQNNMEGLIEKLYDISLPSSGQYGKWLSKEEVCVRTDRILVA